MASAETEPVGREVEIAAAAEALADALSLCGTVLVVGEAGAGKTLLLETMIERQLGRRAERLVHRCGPLEHRVPGAMMRALLGVDCPESALEAISERRREAPLLIAVDDLDHADAESIASLGAAFALPDSHSLALFASARPGALEAPPLAGFCRHLEVAGEFSRIDLGPLDEDGVARLAESHTGRSLERDQREELAARSAGNPLLILHAIGSAPPGTDSAMEIVHRFIGADQAAAETAAALALLKSFEPRQMALVAEMTGIGIEDTVAAFDRLAGTGTIVAEGGGFSFRHPLVAEALATSIPPARRWDWHRRAADAVRSLPPSPDRLLRLAEHLDAVAHPGDLQAARSLLRAGDLLAAEQPEEAGAWYRRALELAGEEAAERAEIELRLAWALFRAGDSAAAATVGRRALDGGNVTAAERKRMVVLVAESLMETADSEAALEVLLAEGGAPSRDVRQESLRAQALAENGRDQEAAAAARGAEGVLPGARTGDRAVALSHLAFAGFHAGRMGEMRRHLGELMRVVRDARDRSRLLGLAAAAYLYGIDGETGAASDAIAQAEELLPDNELAIARGVISSARAMQELGEGRWDAALETARANGRLFEAADLPQHVGLAVAVEGEVLARRGRWQEARGALSRHGGLPAAIRPMCAAALAAVELWGGNPERARRSLLTALEETKISHGRSLLSVRLAEAHLLLDEPDAALATLDAHAPLGSLDQPTAATALRLRALAGEDAPALDAAAEIAERIQDPFLLATVELARGQLADDGEESLATACRAFARLGADPWRRRAAVALRDRGLPVPRHRAAAGSELTDVEIQVARLVQQGSRNREIAEALCVSVKSVEAYLTRIYAKTGCGSRLDLARALDARTLTLG